MLRLSRPSAGPSPGACRPAPLLQPALPAQPHLCPHRWATWASSSCCCSSSTPPWGWSSSGSWVSDSPPPSRLGVGWSPSGAGPWVVGGLRPLPTSRLLHWVFVLGKCPQQAMGDGAALSHPRPIPMSRNFWEMLAWVCVHTPGLCQGPWLGAPQVSDLLGCPPGPMSQCLPWAGTSPVSRTAGHKPRTTQGRLQKAGPLGGQPSPPPLTPVHGWGRGRAHLSLSPSLCATSLSLSFSIHG